jgi:2-hydroxychromene-2-carboxylate isomerase
MARTVDFYFDFISPYAYVGWNRIHTVAKKNDCRLHAIPVLFAALLSAHGTKGPAEVPAKRVYVFKDAYRKAHQAGLPPLVPPPSHPFNPLFALRACTAVADEAERTTLVSAIYRAVWGGGGGADTEDKVLRIATDAGLDGARIVEHARTPETKDALRRSTDEAIAKGVFGVPTMIADGELFWGVDALDALDVFLRGEDPLPKDMLAKWAHLPASAQRKGS